MQESMDFADATGANDAHTNHICAGDAEIAVAQAMATHAPDEDTLTMLLGENDATEALAAAADRVRHETVGDAIHLRGLIEFSSYCRQNCMYCGLRRDNARAERYRLSDTEILALAARGKAYGYHTIVLQSGEDAWFTARRLAPIVRAIHEMDLAVTLSVGERTREEYAALKDAGADRYLLRIETTDRALYESLDPGMSFDARVRCLHDLKALGFEVGTGSLIGLPGQTLQMLARDILFFKKIDADMVGIGPFLPHPDTPLREVPHGDLGVTRRMVSLLRLLLPEANIPATTAMETLHPHARELILQSGANVIMPNLTDGEARLKYALYPGKAGVSDTPAACRDYLHARIHALGRTIGTTKGGRCHDSTARAPRD